MDFWTCKRVWGCISHISPIFHRFRSPQFLDSRSRRGCGDGLIWREIYVHAGILFPSAVELIRTWKGPFGSGSAEWEWRVTVRNSNRSMVTEHELWSCMILVLLGWDAFPWGYTIFDTWKNGKSWEGKLEKNEGLTWRDSSIFFAFWGHAVFTAVSFSEKKVFL